MADLVDWSCCQPGCKSYGVLFRNSRYRQWYDHLLNHFRKCNAERTTHTNKATFIPVRDSLALPTVPDKNMSPKGCIANTNESLPNTIEASVEDSDSMDTDPVDLGTSDTGSPTKCSDPPLPNIDDKFVEIDSATDDFKQEMDRMAIELASLLHSKNVSHALNEEIMGIVGSITSSYANHVNSLLPALKECDYNDPLMTTFLTSLSASTRMFQNLKTRKRQEKYFDNSAKLYVAPKEKQIGLPQNEVIVNQEGNQEYVQVHQTWQYVSIWETLTAVCRVPGVLENFKVWKEEAMQPLIGDEISSYLQSPCFRNNPLFMDLLKLALPLEIYLDEVDPCEPLGAKTNIHRTWNVYLRVLLVPARHQAKCYSSFLVTILNSADLQDGKWEVIFKTIANEIDELSSFPIDVDGENVYAALGYCIGDFPAMGLLYRLPKTAGPASNWCCFCHNVGPNGDEKDLIHTAVYPHQFVPRTIESYNQGLEELDLLRKQGNFNQNEMTSLRQKTGYRSECLLNATHLGPGFFHVATHWTADWLHDVLEGVVGYEVLWVLRKLHDDKYVQKQVLAFAKTDMKDRSL